MYDLTLYGKNEFKNPNKKNYNILVVNNIYNEKFMYEIFDEFLKKPKVYMGIDFEFNKVSKTHKDVALMQICLDSDEKEVYIFIINPNNISDKDKLILLLISNKIYKILHGAESLDIPYIFDQLLVKEHLINSFCNNFYDTKFLCDYYNAEHGIKKSCSIYDLLLNQDIIDESKYNELYKIEEDMGPIYLIKIDINKLSDKVLVYSLYDVLFLPELIKKILTYDEMYKLTIPIITNIINKSKRNINDKFNEIEKLVNSINIYYIYYNNKRYILHDIWMLYYTVIMSFQDDIKLLSEINYFKNAIKILSKLFIYLALSRKFKIFKSKNIIFDKTILRDYYDYIKFYYPVYELFITYYNDIYNDIISWF